MKEYESPGVRRYGDVTELTQHLVHIGGGDNFLGLGAVIAQY